MFLSLFVLVVAIILVVGLVKLSFVFIFVTCVFLNDFSVWEGSSRSIVLISYQF